MSALADQLVRELSPEALADLAERLRPFLAHGTELVTTAPAPALITVREAGTQLRVHPRTIRRAIADGRLPHQRPGGRIRISATDLEEWAAAPEAGTPRAQRRPRAPVPNPKAAGAAAAIAGTSRRRTA